MNFRSVFFLNFFSKSRFVDDFYSGKLSAGAAAEKLRNYGVRYLIVPNGSPAMNYLAGRTPMAKAGIWAVYEQAGAMRPRYPGLAKLRPDLAQHFGLGQLAGQVHQFVSR